MKITVIGAGHIGLITSLCFAEKGHQVLCVDNNSEKINQINNGNFPFFEKGLPDFFDRHHKIKSIFFTDNFKQVFEFSTLVFIAVGTPSLANGSADLTQVHLVLKTLERQKNPHQQKPIIVIKSTVPPGTNSQLAQLYKNFDFVSNPEFLREGSAITDGLSPERIVVGSYNTVSIEQLKMIYSPWINADIPFLTMSPESAELSKYAANTFLAARISLINEFSQICEKTGAHIDSVTEAIGLDRRIGPDFLKSGLGYGGSCFPKDIKALIELSQQLKIAPSLINEIQNVNNKQLENFSKKIFKHIEQQVQTHKSNSSDYSFKIAFWGLAFKPNTNDTRESPAIALLNSLTTQSIQSEINLNFYAHDPMSQTMDLSSLKKDKLLNLTGLDDIYTSLNHADLLIIATDWDLYRNADLSQIKSKLKTPVVFDGRNLFSNKKMHDHGLEYYAIGNPQ